MSNASTFEEHLEEVNGDGFTNLVSHYRAEDSRVEAGDTEVCITGKTLDRAAFKGCDPIEASIAGRRRLRR
jgi:hypothetical protein